jgi:L-threonylcarbamoyladenylate synthase
MFENEKFDEILTVLRRGDTILFPTDTVWGIGCDATNEDAVYKVMKIKNQPVGKGFVLLVDSVEMLKNFVDHVHPRIETLLSFHQRPVSIIYDEGIGLASNVLAKDGSVAVRVAQDAFSRALIHQFGKPVVATTANVIGDKIPAYFGEISSEILEKVDFVVRLRQDVKDMEGPSVIARLNEYEELDFIRE